jgi:microcystin-dependent protein
MPLETATYVSQLNNSNPTSTDTVSQADDHLRLIKTALKNTFPNLDQPVTATPAQLNSPLPSGFIGLWSGSVAAIPSGWALCDGTAGTPNLRNRFVMGAGDTYAPGATGGAATATLVLENIPAHTHTISGISGSAGAHNHTLTDPTHTHLYSVASGAATELGTGYTGTSGFSTTTSTNTGYAATGITLGAVSDHTHTFSGTTSSIGSGTAFSIIPPYYALAYIMKI